MSSPTLIESYTVHDYELWEGDWELIQGQPLAMTPSPGIVHQRLIASIFRQMDIALQNCPDCEALFEIDVELSADTVVRPDLVVICYPAYGQRLTRAPELIFEVVSARSARRDEMIKREIYQQEGVEYYILTYPELKKAKVYRLIQGTYQKLGDFQDERFIFELSKCHIEFDFSRIWFQG
ncbi:MAG: Uma2 family endonuclease [Desulfovermiculus sp.]